MLELALVILIHGEAEWIQKAHPWCCGTHDCHRLPKNAVKLTSEGYSFEFRGVKHLVPYRDQKIIRSIDQDYWACLPQPTNLRCFFPPDQGA